MRGAAASPTARSPSTMQLDLAHRQCRSLSPSARSRTPSARRTRRRRRCAKRSLLPTDAIPTTMQRISPESTGHVPRGPWSRAVPRRHRRVPGAPACRRERPDRPTSCVARARPARALPRLRAQPGAVRGLPAAGRRRGELLARALPLARPRRALEAKPIKGTAARGGDAAGGPRGRRGAAPRRARTAPRT